MRGSSSLSRDGEESPRVGGIYPPPPVEGGATPPRSIVSYDTYDSLKGVSIYLWVSHVRLERSSYASKCSEPLLL